MAVVRWLVYAWTLCAFFGRGDARLSGTFPNCPQQDKNSFFYDDGFDILNPGEPNNETKHLFLENCNLTSFGKTQLSLYPNVYMLKLSHNKIKTFELGLQGVCGLLEAIYLDHNRFIGYDLPSGVFSNCLSMHFVTLSGNNMSDAPSDLLQGAYALTRLDCNDCSLEDNDISFISSQEIPRLGYLYLNNNHLSKLDSMAFSNTVNLLHLELSSNKISYLHEDLLRPLGDISFFNISYNQIKSIPEKLFQNKSSLKTLDLSNNLIEYIPTGAFEGTRLTELHLQNNRLTYLPDTFFTEVYTREVFEYFSFTGNPWSCASLNEISLTVKQHNINSDGGSDYGKNLNCTT